MLGHRIRVCKSAETPPRSELLTVEVPPGAHKCEGLRAGLFEQSEN
jgi:hypothetical protein